MRIGLPHTVLLGGSGLRDGQSFNGFQIAVWLTRFCGVIAVGESSLERTAGASNNCHIVFRYIFVFDL